MTVGIASPGPCWWTSRLRRPSNIIPWALLAVGCADWTMSEPGISEVSPATIPWGQSATLMVQGNQFLPLAVLALDSAATPPVRSSPTVAIDGHLLAASSVRWVDATRMEVVAPATLALGPHSLNIRLASNQTVTRQDAFEVVALSGTGEPLSPQDPSTNADSSDSPGLGAMDAGADALLPPSPSDAGVTPATDPFRPTAPCSSAGACPPCATNSCLQFSSPQLLSNLSNPSEEDDPSLTGDLLELYFNSNRGGTSHIWVSRRNDPSQVWPAPVLVEELSTSEPESQPNVSRDGLEIHFTRNINGNWRIMRSTRSSTLAAWSTPERVAELEQPGSDFTAHPSASGLELFMHRRDSGSDTDLFLAVRDSVDAPWSVPSLINELNTPGGDANPVLHISERQVFFDSDRTGSGDIYTALRASVGTSFDVPIAVDSLNTSDPEEGLCISDDLRYAVFVRQVNGDNWELFDAHQ